MNTRHDLRSLVDDVLSDEPKRALIGLRQFKDELEWLDERVIAQARRNKWAWRPIAKLLDVDHTSLSRRYRHVDIAPALRPAAEPTWGQADTSAFYRHRRHGRLATELQLWEASPFNIVPW